jgi:predicted DNA-binding WGR domain protein
MSTVETPQTKPEEPTAEEAQLQQEVTPVQLAYAGPSRLIAGEGAAELVLYGNLRRDPVHLDAAIKDPLRFREAMSALYAVVGSDYRYVPKDRTAYVAYLRMKRETASLGVWQAQQAYFSWMLRNDPLAILILDPIISVHPDQVFFEVFSKDEGSYAKLAFARSAFEGDGQVTHGTTNIDYSQVMFDSIQQMRSYRQTRLSIGQQQVRVKTQEGGKEAGQVLEKSIRIPDTWLRGFLQVQSASALPRDTFSLSPMDLYNVLRYLRMHGDRKGQRRGIRIELVPGEAPRLVLEPWEVVMPGTAGVYKGRVAKVVRVWGRRRLMMVKRLLPFVQSVDVHILGSGLPSFWVLRCGDITFTLGLTGFTAANWSQAVTFDLLLPRKTQTLEPLEKILGHLRKVWFAGAKDLAAATGLKGPELLEALQVGCQQGRVMYDLASDVYRLRPVIGTPLDLNRLEYRNAREKTAHDLLVRRGAVKIVSENRIPGTGLELTGKVTVTEDKREYRPQMMLGEEGQVSKAECTCAFFRKQGLKAGPCAHLIALRLAYADQEAKKLKEGGPRQAVMVETRTYSKRDEKGEDVVQVSLERQRLRVRWGRSGKPMRSQMIRFNTPDEARAAYFARIDELDARGYLDATAG